jgi:transposase
MQTTEEQYKKIEDSMPKLKHEGLNALNVLLYILGNGCKWRSLPEKYGRWHTITCG